MKNLNLVKQEKRLGRHDYCDISHANQTEGQTDNLSVSGSAFVPVSLAEQLTYRQLFTNLSLTHASVLRWEKSEGSLNRIGKNVAESHVRKYAGTSRIWKYAAILIMLLTLGVGQMWGWTFTNAHVYFDNSNSNWASDASHGVQFWPEKSDGSAGLLMSSIDGTKLFYWSGSWSNGDISYFRFASTNKVGWGWQANKSSWDVLNKNVNCYGMTGGTISKDANNKIALYVAGSGTYNNTSAVDLASQSNPTNLAALNSTQTIKCYVKWDGQADGLYALTYAPGTINITSYEMTAHGETTRRTPSITTSANTATVSAARTATTTLEAPEVAGYTFVEWYNATTSTSVSTNRTYTYYPTGANELHARYTRDITISATITPNPNLSTAPGLDFELTTNAPTGYVYSIQQKWNGGYLFVNKDINETFSHFSGNFGVGSHNFRFIIKASSVSSEVKGCDVTLTTAQAYTITLDQQGATTNSSPTVVYGGSGVALADITIPEKTDNIFGGFYTLENGGGTQLIDEDGHWVASVTAYTDATPSWIKDSGAKLFAKWTSDASVLHVTYNDNGKTNGNVPVDATNYDSGDVVTVLGNTGNLEKTGFEFIGWNTAANGSGTPYAPGATFSITESVTLYAQWRSTNWYLVLNNGADVTSSNSFVNKFDGTYEWSGVINQNQVFHIGNGVTAYGPASNTPVTANSSSLALNVMPPTYCYTFTPASQPVVLTLNTNVNPMTLSLSNPVYSVTMNTNGGTINAGGVTSYTYGTGATLPTNVTKTGYDFEGWFDNEGLTGSAVTAISNTATGDKEYRAKWTAKSYAVALKANDGSETTIATISATYDAAMPSADNTSATLVAPIRAGYTFNGYYDAASGGTQYYNSSLVSQRNWDKSSDVSLYAQWTERPYKIVYFADPGWSSVFVYAWDGNNEPTYKNASWPGVQLNAEPAAAGTGTEVINCLNYYYYKFYTDGLGADAEGADGSAHWTKIIFAQNKDATTTGTNKTGDLVLGTNKYYRLGDETDATGGATPFYDWYLMGSFNNEGASGWNNYTHPITMDACGNTGSIVMSSLSSENNQYFKIYRVSTNTTYKYTGGADGEYNDDREISSSEIGTPLTLRIYNSNVNYFRPTATTDYVFRLDVANTDNPVLTVAPNDMTEYNTSLSISGHGHLDKSTGTIQLKQYIPTTITATPEPGYRFTGWTTSGNVAFAGGTSSNDATASFTATADGATITANFSNEGFIYFDAGGVVNQWGDNVYVTFLKSGDWYYHSTNGGLSIANDSWVNNLHTRQMTRIGDSRIYYLDYTKAANGADINSSDLDQISGRVLFTSKSFATGTYVLYEMAAIKRGDFSKTSSNKLFVAENFREDDKNKTGYYVGYWMNYKEEDPGIKLDIHDGESLLEGIPVFQLIEGSDNEYTATYHLSGNNTYSLGLLGDNGTYYNNDNSSTMTSNSCTGWVYVDRQATPGHITTTADGDYKFTLTCSDRLTLSVEYPLSVGDYRLVYSGVLEDTTSAPAHVHPSKIIRQLASGVAERKDTVSFFVTGDWRITLKKCSRVTPEIVWENACVSAEKSASDLGLSGKTGVYIFPLTLSNNNATGCDGVEIGTPQLYQGEYYIRTDVAKGGWEGYTRTYKSRMNYSDYAKMNSGFDYYNCQYAETNKNVKFTIANNYSFCVTDTLEGDKYVPTTGGNVGKLPYQANIRFMYNSATNVINRAYLNGSSEGGVNTFLWMQSTSTSGQPDLYKANGNELEKDTVKFRDHGNWVYQVDIQAEEQARVKLISNYHFNSTDHLQYFKGASGDWSNATTEEILGGTFKNDGADEKHNLRVIYDFKTNQLLSAWLVPASGDVPSTAINTDVMILRQNQDTARQITFASSEHSLTEVDTIYTAVNLTKSFLTTTGGEYERQFYWVSFPYEVKLSEVFGSVGTYGVDWIMQKYNGKKRAKGFWIDSEPNWEFMDISETLNPYEGYVLTLDMSEFGSDSEKWKNSVTELYLYFPSDRRIGSIVQQNITITMDQTGYLCDIERDNRNIKDSYWHCIGSPSFARATQNFQGHDGSAEQWAVANMPFLYEWNKATNELSPVAAGDYKFAPLTGYLVQYSAETISWTNLSRPATPASVAARPVNMEHMPEEVTYRLQLLKGETEEDRTYVRFSENEGVTEAFDFNQDLSKENKKGGNIWTVTGDAIPVAGNSLPMSEQTTVVPVGVKIAADGEYTFAMPDGTNGTDVTLIDNETGTRTSLGLTDYTVTFGKGDYRDRFYLEISPVKNIPTGMENVQGDNVQDAKARKVLIDGLLYIVNDGQVFDARGNKVQ